MPGEDGYVGFIEMDGGILVDDCRNSDRSRYRIANPALIDLEWIEERMVVLSEAEPFRINENLFAEWLTECVSKWMVMSLRAIVFCGSNDAPPSEIDGFDEFFGLPSCADMPEEGELGIALSDYGLVLVNVEAHFSVCDVRESVMDDIAVTLVHEIRHLAQANPYLPDYLMRQWGTEENDAESFARNFCARYPLSRPAPVRSKWKRRIPRHFFHYGVWNHVPHIRQPSLRRPQRGGKGILPAAPEL